MRGGPGMSFNLVFLASSYFLVLLGLIGLLLTRELSPPYLIVTGGSFVLAMLAEVRGGEGNFAQAPGEHYHRGSFFPDPLLDLYPQDPSHPGARPFSSGPPGNKTPRTQKETGLASTLPVIPL